MRLRSDTVAIWKFRPKALYFIVLLPPPHSGNVLGEYRLNAKASSTKRTPWMVCQSTARPDIRVHLYRRRAIVEFDLSAHHFDFLDDAIRHSVSSALREAMYTTLASVLVPIPKRDEMKLIPILVSDLESRGRESEGWIGDGATSFHFRMYDASEERQALVRVSRHLIIVAGAGGRVLQEVVNLAYEKMLYAPDASISNDAVFAFLDGLARYTVPTENTVFLQREFARLGVLLATVQIVVGIWAVVAGGKSSAFIFFSVPVLIVTAFCIYLLIRRLRLVDWR
ncbi:MAG: hypothetical protein WA741_24615 [Candidatus Sulfotelmatobacter sp.]